MKITVVGAVLILVAVIGALVLIRYLNESNKQGPKQFVS